MNPTDLDRYHSCLPLLSPPIDLSIETSSRRPGTTRLRDPLSGFKTQLLTKVAKLTNSTSRTMTWKKGSLVWICSCYNQANKLTLRLTSLSRSYLVRQTHSNNFRILGIKLLRPKPRLSQLKIKIHGMSLAKAAWVRAHTKLWITAAWFKIRGRLHQCHSLHSINSMERAHSSSSRLMLSRLSILPRKTHMLQILSRVTLQVLLRLCLLNLGNNHSS